MLDRDAGPDLSPEALDAYRRELTGYCYRMTGSAFDADDAVQETMVKAWAKADGFEGRSSVRSWLFRIATNVCLDMLRSRQRRVSPVDLGPSSMADSPLAPTLEQSLWVQPMPDARILPESGDPAEIATARESVRLAFVTALQQLPPKQRAVLILCEVLRWQAAEVAELLDTSVASVNSALQRARASLATRDVDRPVAQMPAGEEKALVDSYVAAFEAYDIERLVGLLRDDAILSMPPYNMWLQGSDQMAAWFVGTGIGCKGSRLVATSANGCAAFGSYRPAPDGGHEPFSIQVIEVYDGQIAAQHNFLDTSLFEAFGLPPRLPAEPVSP